MDSAQVKYVVETLLGDSVDKITPLLKGSLISLIKNTTLATDIRKYRYKFDTSNSLIIRYRVRLYSNSLSIVPSSGKYDAFTDEDGVVSVFEYLCDSSNNFITDDFDFDKILYFSFDKRWKGYDPFKD